MRFTCDACVRKVCVCVLDVSSVYFKKMRAFVFVFVFCFVFFYNVFKVKIKFKLV